MKFRKRGPMVAAAVLGCAIGANAQDISDSAYQQIRSLLLEKEARSAAQRKLSASLVYAGNAVRGINTGGVTDLGNPVTTLRTGPQGTFMPWRQAGRPRDIEIQLNAAQAALNAGQFDKATAFLDQVKILNPDHYRLFALRGRLDAAERRNEDAIREYEAALQHLPAAVPEGVLYPVSLRVDLAQIYRDAGDDANAERVTSDAVKEISAIDVTGSARPEFLRLRAATEVAQGSDDSAERDLKEALRLEPRNIGVHLTMRTCFGKRIDRKKRGRRTVRRWPSIHQMPARWGRWASSRARWATMRPPVTTSWNWRRNIPTTMCLIWPWVICRGGRRRPRW